jgi:hypothetical protein
MFAAWQAGASYDAPTIEARGEDGQWHVVLEHFGYPAGMPRQMSVPLPDGKLPKRTTQLRITTNQEIYWDRIVVVYAEPCPQARREALNLVRGQLAQTGYAKRTTGPQRQPHYDYEHRIPYFDCRHMEGLYTAIGPVDALVSVADDALAIFGPGEEIHCDFAAPRQPIPEGWTRRYVLETRGWCKDMDLYTKDGETVGPLPMSGEDTQKRRELHQRYNTRYEAGP